jgi:hypothetical protein
MTTGRQRTTFGTWGSQVQILPLRPKKPPILLTFCAVTPDGTANKSRSNNGKSGDSRGKNPEVCPEVFSLVRGARCAAMTALALRVLALAWVAFILIAVVGYPSKSDRIADIAEGPSCANSRHPPSHRIGEKPYNPCRNDPATDIGLPAAFLTRAGPQPSEKTRHTGTYAQNGGM